MELSLSFDFTLGRFQRDVAAHLAKLRSTLRSLEDGSFQEHARLPKPGTVLQFDLADSVPHAEHGAVNACQECFLGFARSLTEFLDRLIAMRRLVGSRLTIPSELNSRGQVENFVADEFERAYLEVARDTKLSNPAKVNSFEQLAPFEREALLSYFALRRCLEHHAGVPDRQITITYQRPILLAGDVEITEMGIPLPANTGIALGADRPRETFQPGKPVKLQETQLEHIAFTLQMVIAPSVVRAALGLSPIEPPVAGGTA